MPSFSPPPRPQAAGAGPGLSPQKKAVSSWRWMMQTGPDNAPQTSAEKDAQNENDGNKDAARRPPYTVNAVLHFLQHEINRYEVERAQWEMERAELVARITFLNGERKGQEELKRDLVRRIKMLEYSLKQERAKVARLKNEFKTEENDENEEEKSKDDHGPIEVDAIVPNAQTSPIYKQARNLLRQYLNEIGYSEKILDVRSFRVKNLLGIVPGNNETVLHDGTENNLPSREKALDEAERAIIEAANIVKNSRLASDLADDDSDSDGSGGQLDAEAVTALGEFSFLGEEKALNGPTNEEWSTAEQELANSFRQKFIQEKKWMKINQKSQKAENVDLLPMKDVPDLDDDINIRDVTGAANDAPAIQWRINFTLRSHLDGVRALQFHPFEPVLITASEDGTAKMWNLSDRDRPSGTFGQKLGVVDLEPNYTFRGHRNQILSMDMNATGDSFFTGGFDGTICCWDVPPFDIPVYDHYDRRLLSERLQGHTEPVWSLVYHSSSNRLISGSADGTIRLWELGLNKGDQFGESQLKLYQPPAVGARPRALDLVSTENNQLLTAYSGKLAQILDLETGQRVLDFGLDLPDEEVGEINKIISHPTMPVTITAGTDRRIRYFDNATGKLIRSAVAHVESISTLAADPNGLYMLSGSDDGSVRVWDMETRVCVQEIAAHRKKQDMSVLAVAFHPSRPLIGSAGADSLVKVFTSKPYPPQAPQS